MTDLAHGIWAAATASVAYAGHRVAIQWLNVRNDAAKRESERDERDRGAMAKMAALEADFHKLSTEMKTIAVNLRAR